MFHLKNLSPIPKASSTVAILAVFALMLSTFSVSAQGIPEFNMSNTTIGECEGILYDSGGQGGAYGMNENLTTVINPGGIITITFTGTFALELNADSLYVYDGPSSASPLLGTYTGQTLPPVLTANSGTVTFVMHTDTNVSAAGFSLQWSSAQPVPVPPSISVNTIPTCNATQLNINLSTSVQCTWLASAVFTIVANGQNIPVTNVQTNCAAGQTSLVTLTLGQAFTFNCSFAVQMVIQIPDNCGVLYTFTQNTTFQFQNCGVNASIVGSANTVCPGQCAQITAQVTGCFTYTYAWNNGLPPTAGPHTVCPATQTTYSVTVTEVQTGNTVVKTFVLGIENIGIITQAQTVCQSVPNISLQASGIGTWSGNGVISATSSFDPDQANAGINYVYFQTAGCIDSIAITVTPISAQDVTAACPGSPAFQLQATPTGGTWSGPNTTAPGMFDPVAAGTYSITYSVNGCTDVLSVNVDDITGPFTIPPVCQSIWLDTIVFAPFGGVWSGNGIVNTSLGTFAPQDMPAGDQSFTYTINGCNQIFNVFIKEINVDYFHTACPEQSPLVLDNSPLPPGGVWTSPVGAINNATTGLFNPLIIPNNTTTTILYHASNGCVDTMFVYVLQTAVTQSVLSFCLDNPTVALDSALTGGAFPTGGVWTGPGVTGNQGTGYFFNPSVVGVGTYTVTYTMNTCSDIITISVFPNNLSDTPLTFCSSSPAAPIMPTVTPGGTWTGNGITNASTGMFNPAVATPGTFFVYWSSPAGCSDSLSVTVEATQQAGITGLNASYCMQNTNVNFSVSPPGGILLGSLGTNTFNPSQLGPGSYQVIYRYMPAYCPETSDTVDFVIYPELSLSLTASDLLICDNQAVTLTSVVTGGNTLNGYTYSWSNGGFPVATNTSVPGVPTTITVTVDDNCSLPVSASLSIDVVPAILFVIDTSLLVCAGQQGWATAQVALPEGSYNLLWNNTEPTDTLYANAGTTWTLVITDLINGCNAQSQGVIPAFPLVTANFSITPNLACIPFEDMQNIGVIDLSQNGTTGTWNFGNGTFAPYLPGQNLNQAYGAAGNFQITLSIMNDGGCTSQIVKPLCILPAEPLFIPDIFSPNGDRNNDTLFVRGFGVTRIEFHLYDRWGEEVFYTNDVKVGWDGQLRGQPANTGNYFYAMRAFIGNEKIEKTGEIVLVR